MDRLSGASGNSGAGVDLLGALGGVALPETAAKAGGAPGRWWRSPFILLLAAAVFCVQGLASILLPQHGSIPWLGLGGCYAVAGCAAYRRGGRSVGLMRVRWRLVSAGLGLGVLGFALTLSRQCLVRAPDVVTGLQHVTLLLLGLPLLMAVSLSHREHSKVFARLDLAYLMLAAGLAWIAFQLPFETARVGDTALASHGAAGSIIAANLVVAILASVRCFAGGGVVDVRFFKMLASFLWANLLLLGGVSFYAVLYAVQGWRVAPGSPWWLLGDLPALSLLVGLHLFDERRLAPTSKTESMTVADTVGSLLVPFGILLLAVSVAPRHVFVGMAGVAATFTLYGARSVLMQRHSLLIQQELLKANQSIQDQALSDGLTGIPNRRSFDQTLEREWKRAQRSRQPLALLMVDIDHFKELNDEHGHLTGDGCLREIAGLLRGGLGREADFAARYGGEEFAILLVDTGIDGGRIVAESLRRSVEQYQGVGPDGAPLSFTVSIGVASEIPMQQESSVTLVAAADKALYRAKRSGRNRVEVHAWRTSPDEGLL